MKHVLILGACCLISACQPDRPVLTPLPAPELSGLSAADRDKLISERRKLELMLSGESGEMELASAYANLGQAYMAFDLTNASIAAFENAITLNARDGASHYRVGLLLLRAGDFKQALDHLSQAVALRPADCAALLRSAESATALDRYDQAQSLLSHAVTSSRCSAAANDRLARLALAREQPAAAKDYALAALAQQPAANALHSQLSTAYRMLGKREKAAQHAALAGTTTTEFEDPLVSGLGRWRSGGLGLLREADQALEKGDSERAQELLEEALRREPDLWRAHLSLGRVLTEKRDLKQAEKHIVDAIRLEPGNTAARLDLAVVQSRQGEFESAINTLRELLESKPDQLDALVRRAELYLLTGQVEAAKADLVRAVNNNDFNLDAQLRLASLNWRLGQSEAAITVLSNGLDSQPDSSSREVLQQQRLLMRARAGDIAGALEDADRLMDAGNHNANAYAQVLNMILQESDVPSLQFDKAESLSRVAISLGLYSLSEALVENAIATPDRQSARDTALDRARLAQTESPEAALAIAVRLGERFRQSPSPEIAELTAIALNRAGENTQALQWQSQLIDLAKQNGASQSVLARLWSNRQAMLAGSRASIAEEFGLDR